MISNVVMSFLRDRVAHIVVRVEGLPTNRVSNQFHGESLLLSYPKTLSKVTLGNRPFTYAAPKLWNAPSAIISMNTVTGFKGKLKTFVF